MQNFVLFHAIESKIGQSQEFWEKRSSRAPFLTKCTQIALFLLIMMYILYTISCGVLSTKNRDQRIPKTPLKV